VIDLLAMKRSTLPMGNRRYGGGGGDGGYAERQAEMKAEQDAAIAEVNSVFGKGQGRPIYETRYRDVIVDPGSMSGDSSWTPATVYQQPYEAIVGYDTAARDAAAAERDALYGTITQDASARLLDRLSDDRRVAERGTKFQLARQGLAGGSADVDQNAEILRKFNEGSLEAGNAALASGNSARSADEQTRIGIINNIRNGMAASDAISASFAGLTNNANEARDAAMATNIGGFFDDINRLNEQRQFNMGYQSRAPGSPRPSGVTTSANAGGNNGRIYG
jgi:hypothetical protein